MSCSFRFESRIDAETFIDQMESILERYCFASVADACELAGVDYGYTDNNRGWVSLSKMYTSKIADHYTVFLPNPMPVAKHTVKLVNRSDNGLIPGAIYDAIKSIDKEHEYTCVIMGRTGPTGKTTLCNRLKNAGYKAIELSEAVNGLIDYIDNSNHLNVNDETKTITVVMNKRI